MKKIVALMLGTALLGTALATPSHPLRIMPLGDSITYGSHSQPTAGYRGPLYTLLTNANYTIDYVGTFTDTQGTLPDADHEHQGKSGWTTQNVIDYLPTAFSSILSPNVVLLHIGTNDTKDQSCMPTIAERYRTILDMITTTQPSAYVIAANVIERTDSTTKDGWLTTYLNQYLPDIAAEYQAKGKRVYFLDMRSQVSTSGLDTDGLHPVASGYQQMAEAWFAKIQELVPTPTSYEDTVPAVVTATYDQLEPKQMSLIYNEPIEPALATNTSNYTLAGTLADSATVASASLASNNRSLTLSFANLTGTNTYTLTTAAITNEYGTAGTVGDVRTFTTPEIIEVPAGAKGKTPEFGKYRLAYSIELPSGGANYGNSLPVYDVDNSANLGAFSRIAYYLELRKTGGSRQYVWVSMDAWTNDITKIAIPAGPTGVVAQQYVSNLKYWSNVAGTNEVEQGFIEFYRFQYSGLNACSVPGASASDYDFGDSVNTAGSNYGAMQVHDYQAKKTLFAYNRWRGDTNQDLGIGNRSGTSNTDWTTAQNSSSYDVRTLQVYVMPDPTVVVVPEVESVKLDLEGNLTVKFNTAVDPEGLVDAFTFAGNNVAVSATVSSDDPTVVTVVAANALDPAVLPTLTISGVRAADALGTPMAAAVTVTAQGAMPAEVAANVPAALTEGYCTVYQAEVPVRAGWTLNNATESIYSVNHNSYAGKFDRVAYYLQLVDSSANTNWVWVSMDAFTNELKYVGFPLKCNGVLFTNDVYSLDVASSVAGVTTGTGIAKGNLEFTYGKFNNARYRYLENGSASTYDFDDILYLDGDYGCLQVHNTAACETILAINRWGRTNADLDVGIGNRSSGNPDWTGAANGASYVSRTLWVLVRPVAETPATYPELPAPATVLQRVPQASDYSLVYDVAVPAKGVFGNSTSYAAAITVDNSAQISSSFSRVAYYLELVSTAAPAETNWVWVSMNAFTNSAAALVMPNHSGKVTADWTIWQQVECMDVFSNLRSVTTGTGIGTGTIEFTNCNYSGDKWNTSLAGGSGFDYNNKASTSGDYGCLHINNLAAQETVLSLCRLYRSDALSIGIGNSANSKGSDWTYDQNAASFSVRRLLILVRETPDDYVRLTAAPTRVVTSADRTRLAVTFDAELRADQVAAMAETLELPAGVALVAAERSTLDSKELLLTVTPALPSASTLTLLAPSATWYTLEVPDALPDFPHAAQVDEASGYTLAYSLALAAKANYAGLGAPYAVDESRFGTLTSYDRIAYSLELVTDAGVTNWVWASLDAFSDDIELIGVPSVTREQSVFWQDVENLHAYAGTGDGSMTLYNLGDLGAGNIEFCPGNYTQGNIRGVTYASDSDFDWGDSTNENSFVVGCGSMQIHNPLGEETVFSLSSFGNNREVGVGFGRPVDGSYLDYTYAKNAGSYTVKNLRIYVRQTAIASTGAGEGPSFVLEPQSVACERTKDGTTRLSAVALDAVRYQWRKNGVAIPLATKSWYEAPIAEAGDSVYDVVAYLDAENYTVSAAATVHVYLPGTKVLLR